MTMVIDTSVTMAWCFDDEATPATDGVFSDVASRGAVVPNLWRAEVANVLVVAERRGRIDQRATTTFLDLLGQLPIRTDDPADAARLVIAARSYGISAYDATYLVLAESLGIPLATLDRDLAAAARAAAVVLVELPA
jgi:predicted nucleic acid-binding protein